MQKEKCWSFIRIMFWTGVAASSYLIIKALIFVATFDFCPFYYGVECF